ncbi:MAG: 2-C-methyl-D-erythritol 2,4-cyclodiphosphate synthase [Bacteroidales bacterium]|jgi:2-C-methyl-D-erythritol 2,4-cyclodiphosphate synthase|nr:2-C-methyl-D-erythritol 2,4-cyclodiphosphate synthase [Bacteroidales bacterium]
MTKFRTGFGFDVHPLKKGAPLVLGGVVVPHDRGAVGHSDADTLIHALCDALLGAANLGDIGTHFSDTDPSLKGIDSRRLLKETVRMVKEKGYRIGNIDAVVCLQRPKIRPWVRQMAETMAETMDIPADDVSVKATTTERLGFTGREEGVAAYATVLLYTDENGK